jgi:hypothetical protein
VRLSLYLLFHRLRIAPVRRARSAGTSSGTIEASWLRRRDAAQGRQRTYGRSRPNLRWTGLRGLRDTRLRLVNLAVAAAAAARRHSE